MVAALLVLIAGGTSLSNQFAAIARQIDGKVGVAVQLMETRETVSLNGDERFPTQSVYKVPISMAVLHAVEKGRFSLSKRISIRERDLVPFIHSPIREASPHGRTITVSELIKAAVVESDGTASDVLMRLAGGAKPITAYLRSVGVDAFTVAATEREQLENDQVQYRNWSTPKGAIDLLQRLQFGPGLSRKYRLLVLRYMTETNTFPHRIKGLLPTGTVVAHKTGSSNTDKSKLTRVTNDIGIISLPDGRHLAVAVFIRDSHAGDAARDLVIARMAKAAWDHWARDRTDATRME